MNYVEELEKVARSEWLSTLFWAAVLIILAVIIWIVNYRYFKKEFQKHNKPAKIKQTEIAYKKSKWACLCLTIIMALIGTLFTLLNVDTITDINKDIELNSFKVYNGGFYVEHDFNTKSYPKMLSVYLNNGDTAIIYNRNFIEYLFEQSGEYNGRVVYGENSGIVVEMKKDK